MMNTEVNTKEILHAISNIEEYTKGVVGKDELKSKHMTYDAVLMNIVSISEFSKRLSEDFKQANPHIDWNVIKNYRDIITKGYFAIDEKFVWNTIKVELPQLKTDFEKLLK